VGTRDIHNVRFEHPRGQGALVEVIRLDELRRRGLPFFHSPQRRNFHVVHVVTKGRGKHHFEFGVVSLRRGDVFHVRPGQVDWYDRDSNHEALLIIFVPEAVTSSAPTWPRVNNPLRPSADDFERLEGLALLMDRYQQVPHLRSAATHLLNGFVDALASLRIETAPIGHSPARVELCQRFEELVEQSASAHRSVSWYADALGVSAKTLARACEAVFGASAKQHLDRRIALRAKRMLVHTTATVEDIAVELGFSEPTNFVKFFRRLEGCTPRAFRDRFSEPAKS